MSGPGIMKFFQWQHLPEHLQATSKPFCELAERMAIGFDGLDPTAKAEVVAGLRKLLEAKDCFVRARLCVEVEHANHNAMPPEVLR